MKKFIVFCVLLMAFAPCLSMNKSSLTDSEQEGAGASTAMVTAVTSNLQQLAVSDGELENRLKNLIRSQRVWDDHRFKPYALDELEYLVDSEQVSGATLDRLLDWAVLWGYVETADAYRVRRKEPRFYQSSIASLLAVAEFGKVELVRSALVRTLCEHVPRYAIDLALSAADIGGNLEVIRLLRAYYPKHESEQLVYEELQHAIELGELKDVQLLIWQASELGDHKYRLLFDAVHTAHLDIVQFLVETIGYDENDIFNVLQAAIGRYLSSAYFMQNHYVDPQIFEPIIRFLLPHIHHKHRLDIKPAADFSGKPLIDFVDNYLAWLPE